MLTIVPVSGETLGLYNQIENRYLVSELATVRVTRSGFSLEYTVLPQAQWRDYPDDEVFTASELLKRRDAECLFAFLDGVPVGQAVIVKNWNNLAMLWDLRVDTHHRRKGIGRELLAVCRDWAKSQGLQGIMLETQDTNPSACQFYQNNGFVLGGVDRLLYGAMPHQVGKPMAFRETALFFYIMLNEAR